MYDAGRIIPGLIIFLILALFPVWSNVGGAAPVPDPVKPTKAKECVLDTQYMKAEHMRVLDIWRDQVVREGDRIFVNDKGKQFNMSLSKTCMECHDDKGKFCDRCHNYLNVNPYCWDCHLEPKGSK
jgi:hypothetical protein